MDEVDSLSNFPVSAFPALSAQFCIAWASEPPGYPILLLDLFVKVQYQLATSNYGLPIPINHKTSSTLPCHG
jgi:hypothetical protein